MPIFTVSLHAPHRVIQCWSYNQLVNVLEPLRQSQSPRFASFALTGRWFQHRRRETRAFAFLGPLWDDCAAVSAPNRIMGLTGFGVMESPDRRGSQPRERIPRQGGCRSTLLCALRPWLREADAERTLLVGLAFCTLNPPPRSSLKGKAVKRCDKCGETKPLDAFYRSVQRPDGLQRRCKLCQHESRKQGDPRKRAAATRRWQLENREKVNVYRREWAARDYAANPDKWLEKNARLAREGMEALSDGYVTDLIAKRIGAARAEVPQELVQAKRAHLRVKRLITKGQNEIAD